MSFPALRSRLAQFTNRWRGLLEPIHPGRSPEAMEPSHSLLPLQTEWVDTAPGLQVTCLDGCLLLNYEGQQKDIILVRGESHACMTTGRIAVQALVATSVLVH